jgi:hypothetical protein
MMYQNNNKNKNKRGGMCNKNCPCNK